MRSFTRTELPIDSGVDPSNPTEDEIAALVYQLWKDRADALAESPGKDWFERNPTDEPPNRLLRTRVIG